MRRSSLFAFPAIFGAMCSGCEQGAPSLQSPEFARALGYEQCRIVGPLTAEQSRATALKWGAKTPNNELETLIAARIRGDELFSFDCLQSVALENGRTVAGGEVFLGLVRGKQVLMKGAGLIID